MRLLFDANLSFRLCDDLSDLFPDALHVRNCGLAAAGDREIWGYARSSDRTIVSKDADFAELAVLLGPPPKVIWFRAGNLPLAPTARIFRRYAAVINAFDEGAASCLELY